MRATRTSHKRAPQRRVETAACHPQVSADADKWLTLRGFAAGPQPVHRFAKKSRPVAGPVGDSGGNRGRGKCLADLCLLSC